MLSLEGSNGLKTMGELLLGSKGQCGLRKGWAVCLEWPPSLNFLPSPPLARGVRKEPYSGPFPPNPPQVAVQVPKPAFFRHLFSAEHTREEAGASEPLPYEKYNKKNWMQQLGSRAEAAGKSSSGHGGLCPPRPR